MEINELLEERGKTHGDIVIQSYFSQEMKSVLRASPHWKKMSSVKRECLEMVVHKIARILAGNHEERDHYYDIIGYTQLILNEIEKENQ